MVSRKSKDFDILANVSNWIRSKPKDCLQEELNVFSFQEQLALDEEVEEFKAWLKEQKEKEAKARAAQSGGGDKDYLGDDKDEGSYLKFSPK